MRHKNIFRSILLIISIFLITSCSNNSAMKPEDFKNKEPRLVIEEYMTGNVKAWGCLLYTSPSPRDRTRSRMPSSA